MNPSNYLQSIAAGAALVALLTLTAACDDGGPYVMVDGSKYTAEDLKEQRPEAYNGIRKEYEKQIANSLQQLAIDRLFELEAKNEGFESSNEFIAHLRSQAQPPSEQEIVEFYQQLKQNGQIPPDAGLPGLRDRIAQSLMQQRGQELVMGRLQELREKYNYQVYEGDASSQRAEVAVGPDDHIRLNPEGKVTVVEFSDFACGWCRRAQEVTAQVREKYGDQLRWVVKDYPLQPGAMEAHVAANCVFRQDKSKYWEFFDAVYAGGRPALQPQSLRTLAADLGADLAQYDQCLENPEIQEGIQEDLQLGQQLNVRGTPNFFINGRHIEGFIPFEEFDRIVQQELDS